MKVYILTRIDAWQEWSIRGVFKDLEIAKQFAEEENRGEYTWERLSDGGWFTQPHLFTGPVYKYEIEEHEVSE